MHSYFNMHTSYIFAYCFQGSPANQGNPMTIGVPVGVSVKNHINLAFRFRGYKGELQLDYRLFAARACKEDTIKTILKSAITASALELAHWLENNEFISEVRCSADY